MQRIVVGLLQPFEKVDGKVWPRLKNGEPLEVTGIEGPCDLKVVLPNGHSFEIPNVKRASIEVRHDIVAVISALPLESAVPLSLAVEQTRNVLQRSGIADRVGSLDEWMKLPIADGPKRRVAASRILGPGVRLHVELRQHTMGHGWYSVLNFAQDHQKEG